MASQLVPSSVYSHDPLVLSTSMTATPFTAPRSTSTVVVVKADTSLPALVKSSSLMAVKFDATTPTGASFAAVTVTSNVVCVVVVPSSTVTVIVAGPPFWFSPGSTLIVRLTPDPPSVMLASGTRVWLLLVAVTVNEPAAVSTSPMVMAIAPVAVSSSGVWSAIVVMVGASLSAATVTSKVV